MYSIFYFRNIFLVGLFLLIGACNQPTGVTTGPSGPLDWQKGDIIQESSPDELSEDKKEKYRIDAEKLAVRRINELDSTRTDIPTKLVDHLYNGLVHIVQSEAEGVDKISGEYEVHALQPSHPREVLIWSREKTSWMENWQAGQTETGQPRIDSLLHEFDLTLQEYNEYEHGTGETQQIMARFRSDRPVNGYAIGSLFMQHDIISTAGPEGMIGPTDITVQFKDDHLRYTFEYGWGDCPAGCINEHRWTYNVYKNGSVSFEGESGQELPE